MRAPRSFVAVSNRSIMLAVCTVLVTGNDARAAHLEKVVDGLQKPIVLTSPPGDPRLFIIEMEGRIRIVGDGELLPTPFLDLSSQLETDGLFQGLLGLTFHPDYATNGYFFVNYTIPGLRTRISRFEVSADPDIADPGTESVLLTVDQPGYDHNGGYLAFGPNDGYLYVSLGDGGYGSDFHESGQDPSRLLGKILRIDVDVPTGYAIPPDNPFVGVPGYREEIWTIGIRSPWGMSFDRETHDLWLADVGLDRYEEVNFQPAASPGGLNYGWSMKEADACYIPPTDCDDPTFTPPVYSYAHGPGCSVNGGFVYRGSEVPELYGCYFFSDWCTSEIWTFKYDGSTLTELTNRSVELGPPPGDDFTFLVGFGEDASGELYAIDWHWTGTNLGQIFKIVSDVTGVPGDAVPGVTPALVLTTPQPNPFAERTRFAVATRREGTAQVAVHDATGRRVWVDEVPVHPSAPTFVQWQGRDARGRDLAPGVYFLQVRLGEDVAARRLQLAR